MQAAVTLPGFISEYLQLFATALAITVVVAIVLFIRRMPEWARSSRAASWPIAQGTIESVSVKTVSGQALGELAYSYIAEGERYSGYALLQFANEQDAWKAIDPLKGKSILVRYRSGNPTISAVRAGDQNLSVSMRQERLIRRLVTKYFLEIVGLGEWREWTKLAAGSWPVVKGRIESGTIAQERDGATWFLFPDYTVEVRYSYSFGGEYYSGYILRSFFRERSAKKFVDDLKDTGVFVRYSQGSPEISVLRHNDQQLPQSA